MSKTTTGTLSSTLSWNVVDTLEGQGRLNDNGSIGIEFAYANGTGTGTTNQLYYDIQTLPSGGKYDYDLTALEREAFGSVLESSFNTGVIHTLIVTNNASETGGVIYLAATGLTGFTGPFANGTGNIPVHAQSSINFNNILTGYPVNSTKKDIQIIDGGLGSQFEIVFIGRTGVL